MLPIRVLVVDDSVAIRGLVSEALANAPEIQVVGTAWDGAMALAKIPQLNPDVVTLDVAMPRMDGITTLTELRRSYPKLPVIMFSALTEHGAAITVEALATGASDYVTKPSQSESVTSAIEFVRSQLVPKIISLTRGEHVHAANAVPDPWQGQRRWPGVHPIEVLAIGASTGGPTALAELLGGLPADFAVPVVVVQHMPPLFTRFLAERLNSQSALAVKEAEYGKKLRAGEVWIARGDFHMTVGGKGTEKVLELNQNSPENSCRPAVDVLFRSVAEVYGPGALAVVLTGMGSDGARGALRIREAGGEVLAQDKESSVVWGMPGAVVSAGAANGVYSLHGLGPEIVRRVRGARAHAAAHG